MATTAATGTVSTSVPQKKKKNRPNPARRKASHVKGLDVKATSDDQPKSNSVPPTKAAISSQQLPSTTTVQSRAPTVASKPAAKKPRLKQTPKTIPGVKSSTVTSKPPISPTPSALMATPAVDTTSGLIGCAASAFTLLGAGLWRDIAGPSAAILSVRTAKLCFDNFSDELIAHLHAGTYNAPEALDILRRTTLVYASAIPGGAAFVERMFREVEMVRVQRRVEVDRVVAEACRELATAERGRASEGEVGTVVGRQLVRLSEVASGATRDVLERNPALMKEFRRTIGAAPERKVPTVKCNMVVRQMGK
ncbi:hypothetical protein TI39_contig601g00005 [Zymoseptoria brevis]|uniref:Uncharacterized protein n=1 Tax=Zymoseptoria brevis TaxID=1047168 RepID=A0A0F4GHC4_9PEZI|nr:hypothetical protein TI39_contig601g00005 [Zymoseptoria brevis]